MNAAPAPGPEDPISSAAVADPLADDRALWNLLDRAVPPLAPGPFFARRVLRTVANFEEERRAPAWRRRLAERLLAQPRQTTRRTMVAWSGASFAGVAAGVILAAAVLGLLPVPSAHHHRRHHRSGGAQASDAAGLNEATFRDGDTGVIADLDELLDSNENRVWQDDDSTS